MNITQIMHPLPTPLIHTQKETSIQTSSKWLILMKIHIIAECSVFDLCSYSYLCIRLDWRTLDLVDPPSPPPKKKKPYSTIVQPANGGNNRLIALNSTAQFDIYKWVTKGTFTSIRASSKSCILRW